MSTNLTRFQSLAHPQEYGYLVSSRSTEYYEQAQKSGRAVCTWAAMFPTYGDGIVQHAPEFPVQQEYLQDFLYSFLQNLLEHPDEQDLLAHWPICRLSRKSILWANTLRKRGEDEKGKTRYICVSELKTSTAESKRHDKRWHAWDGYNGLAEAWNTQTLPGIRGLLLSDYSTYAWDQPGDFLARLVDYVFIEEVLDQADASYWPSYRSNSFWSDEHQGHLKVQKELFAAVRGVSALADSIRQREFAQRILDDHNHRIIRDLERHAQESAASQAS